MKRYRWEDITVEDLFIYHQFGTNVESYSENRQLVVGRKQVLVAIKCDLCDYISFDDVNECVHQEFVSVKGEFGWPTLYDGQRYDIDVCSHCIAKATGIIE